jgi:hypothetical protein
LGVSADTGQSGSIRVSLLRRSGRDFTARKIPRASTPHKEHSVKYNVNLFKRQGFGNVNPPPRLKARLAHSVSAIRARAAFTRIASHSLSVSLTVNLCCSGSVGISSMVD